MESNVVYSSIVDGDYDIDAIELGSNFLFVMSVIELPTSVGEVYFEVIPFVEHGGIKVTGACENLKATVIDGKVTIE